MLKTVPDILARIVEHKKAELVHRVGGIARAAEDSVAQRRDFLHAITSRQPAIIAEIKKASPSKGVLPRSSIQLQSRRPTNKAARRHCPSSRTKNISRAVWRISNRRARPYSLPVLRKDFTIDAYHVHQAAAHGADAILLIAAILSERQMRDFRELAERYGMAALVEVHDEEELEPAIASGARIIGVNNRNLHTFEVDLDASMRLAGKIPDGVVKVAESGIHSSRRCPAIFARPVIRRSWWASI